FRRGECLGGGAQGGIVPLAFFLEGAHLLRGIRQLVDPLTVVIPARLHLLHLRREQGEGACMVRTQRSGAERAGAIGSRLRDGLMLLTELAIPIAVRFQLGACLLLVLLPPGGTFRETRAGRVAFGLGASARLP